MNKKFKLAVIPAVALGCFVAVNNNFVNNTSMPAVMAASKHQNFSKQNYALMAFLQWSNQDLQDVQDQSIALTAGKNNTFITQSDDGQKITITVGHTKVTVKDANGNKKTFTKAKLEKAFKNQIDALNNKITSNNDNGNNADNENNAGNTTSQPSSQNTQGGGSNQATSDDDDDDDGSDDGSKDGYTFEERTHLDPNDPDFIPATHDNFEGFN